METAVNHALDGRIALRQPVRGFRSGSDAVLLAAACHPRPGGLVVELGCGTGSALLCLGWRRADLRLLGVEVSPETAALAAHNLAQNGMAARGAIITGNVRALPLPRRAADLVLANPPFFAPARHRPSPDPARRLARSESGAVLADWTSAAIELLKPGGEAIFLLRSERLAELAAALPAGWRSALMPIIGAPDKPPKRALLRLTEGRNADGANGAGDAPPLCLRAPDGGESPRATAIFRRAEAIFWPGMETDAVIGQTQGGN